MCRFKSGIIFKTRCVVAPGENDSHGDLLRELNIEDTYANAFRMFVRAELVPEDNEWWTDPDGWKYVVDQDVTPDWYDIDPGKYEEEFRQSVKAWWSEHVLVDKKIDELNDGYYRLKRCEVKKLLNDVKVYLDDSTVGKMWDNSTVKEMGNNSTVKEMWDNSTVKEMWGSSTVERMFGNSTVERMGNNSTVKEMFGNSTVRKMCDNSTVGEMFGSSTVKEMRGSSTVGKMCGNSTVRKMCDNSTVKAMCGSSTAKDFKKYPNIKIHIPKGGKFEMVEHGEK